MRIGIVAVKTNHHGMEIFFVKNTPIKYLSYNFGVTLQPGLRLLYTAVPVNVHKVCILNVKIE